jgi:hypothetical protein
MEVYVYGQETENRKKNPTQVKKQNEKHQIER